MSVEDGMHERIAWVDTLRGIGIFFVVLGHFYTSDSPASVYIYTFHVPLFFFISGYLFRGDRYPRASDFLIDKALTRLVPYLFFFLVSYLLAVGRVSARTGLDYFSVLATDHFGPMFLRKAALLLRSNGEALNAVSNIALWFIPCLIVTEVLFHVLHKLASADMRKIGAVLLLAAVGGYAESVLSNTSRPWAIDTALTALVFYGLGYVGRRYQLPKSMVDAGNKRPAVLLFVLSTALCILFGLLNGRVDMNVNHYGKVMYFYAGALSGILSYVAIAPLFPMQRLFSFLGRNTFIILGIHMHVFPYATAGLDALSGLFLEENQTLFINDDLYVFIISCIVLVFIAPIAYGVNRFAPFLVGKKRSIRSSAG